MDGRGHEQHRLLTCEEQSSLSLLVPFVTRHLELILETFTLHLAGDPYVAWLLEDDLAVERFKRSQRRYLLALLTAESPGLMNADDSRILSYRDPFGLGARWHLRTLAHFVTALQPLVQEAFEEPRHLYRTAWTALLKVVFRDLDLVMSACLSERDEWVEAARQEECEAKRALDYLVNRHEAEADQRLMSHLKLMEELTIWRTNVCGLAREMGTPLNMILGQAESVLKQSTSPAVQNALQCIVEQVERLIQLRQPLCRLDQEFGHNGSPAGQQAASEGNSSSDQGYVGDWTRKPR